MMPNDSHSLTARMRAAIAAEHEAIEQTPFSVHMMTGSLSRDVYVTNLTQMLHIHHCIESLATNAIEMQPYFTDEMRRSDVILHDLNALGYLHATAEPNELDSLHALSFDRERFAPLPETSRCIDHVDQQARACPVSLIGGIYVLEGSRMGSLVLAKPLARCLQVSGAPRSGIDYHVAGAAAVRQRLMAWKAVVDAAPFEADVADAIVGFASQFMLDLLKVYRAMPVSEPAKREVA